MMKQFKNELLKGLNKKERAMVIAAAVLVGFATIGFYGLLFKALFGIIF